MSARFHLAYLDRGEAVVVWKGGSARVYGYSVSEQGIELETEPAAALPAPAALIRTDYGAMGASVWLLGRDELSSSSPPDQMTDPSIRSQADDARRFRFIANSMTCGPAIKPEHFAKLMAAKTIGDFRAAVDAAELATDEKAPS